MMGREASFDIRELIFFVHIDEDVAGDGIEEAGAFYFAGLENDIAIGEQGDRAKLVYVLEDVESAGIEPLSEGVFDEEMGDGEQMQVVWVIDAVLLQSAEVVGVADLGAQLFEQGPVALSAFRADVMFEMIAEVAGHGVVVEKRVVDIEEEGDGSGRVGHGISLALAE
jgi:hypothetical protein